MNKVVVITPFITIISINNQCHLVYNLKLVIMKKVFIFFVVLFAASFFFIGCKPSMTPERVVDKYLTLVSNHEYAEAANYCTEETAQILLVLASMSEDEEPAGEKHENIKCDIDGDKASCTYNVAGSEATEVIDLIRVDDEWKIHMEK